MKLQKVLIAGGNPTLLAWNCPAKNTEKVIKKYLDGKNIEQIGFVQTNNILAETILRMMGGEFCVNATLALASKLSGNQCLKTNGIEQNIQYRNVNSRTIIEFPLTYKMIDNIVLFEGIGFILFDESMKRLDVEMLKNYAKQYNVPAFGVIFFKGNAITPYVYVVSTQSCIKETACGSGSIAFNIFSGIQEIKQPTGQYIQVLQNDKGFRVSANVSVI